MKKPGGFPAYAYRLSPISLLTLNLLVLQVYNGLQTTTML